MQQHQTIYIKQKRRRTVEIIWQKVTRLWNKYDKSASRKLIDYDGLK